MKQIDRIFNSEQDNGTGYFQIASGHIAETAILFSCEKIVAVVNAKGSAAFYNENDELLATGEVPGVNDGKGVYQELCCHAEDGLITLKFPIVEWIDNYPHCDGEHDRWDSRIIGEYPLTFDIANGKIQ